MPNSPLFEDDVVVVITDEPSVGRESLLISVFTVEEITLMTSSRELDGGNCSNIDVDEVVELLLHGGNCGKLDVDEVDELLLHGGNCCKLDVDEVVEVSIHSGDCIESCDAVAIIMLSLTLLLLS